MTQADERTLLNYGLSTSTSHRSEVQRGWWWPLIGGAVLVAVVAFFVGRASAPDGKSPEPIVEGGTAAEMIEPGALLGPVVGANRYASDDDVDRFDYAWPGQELIAPEPSTGDAVAWQWQLCDVPPEPEEDDDSVNQEPPPLECRDVNEATDERWASPTTNRTRLVRVIVTIDLGSRVKVNAATTPVAASTSSFGSRPRPSTRSEILPSSPHWPHRGQRQICGFPKSQELPASVRPVGRPSVGQAHLCCPGTPLSHATPGGQQRPKPEVVHASWVTVCNGSDQDA